MSRSVSRFLVSRVMAPVLAIALVWQAWMMLRPKPFPLDDRRRVAIEGAATKLAGEMPVPQSVRPTLQVAQFEGDTTGFVTDATRRAIDRRGRYVVQSAGITQNLMKELGIPERSISPDMLSSFDVKGLKCDYLLAGRVLRLSDDGDIAEAALEAGLFEVASPPGVKRLVVEARHGPPDGAGRRAVRSHPWPLRLLGWLAFALLLPLVLTPLVRRGLSKESNALNLAMLAGSMSVAVVAAYAMIGFRHDTWWSAALLLPAAASALAYNWLVLSRQERLRR